MRRLPLFVAALLALPSLLLAESSSVMPKQLQEVRFDQKVGDPIPADAIFRDERGREVRLGEFFGKRPVVLALVYYRCPMLCTLVLNGLVGTLRALEMQPGRDFDVLAVSFDPKDSWQLAAEKKQNYLASYGRPSTEAGWHFLTGDSASIRRLTDAAGFRYSWDEKTDQYAHAAGVMVLTPGGRFSRYLYGIDFPPRDLKFALLEASEGKIGSISDRALLYCFHYDPATGRYSAAAIRLLRIAGALTVFALAGLMLFGRRRSRPSFPQPAASNGRE
jgi:protein SCO1/2